MTKPFEIQQPEDIFTFLGMTWIDVEKVPENIIRNRKDGYKMANKELFYWNEGTVEDDKEEIIMKNLLKMRGKIWGVKWEVDFNGNSPYFAKAIEPSPYW
jgi:hypothetical protein